MDSRPLSFLEAHSAGIVFLSSLAVIYLLLPSPLFTWPALFLTALFMVIFSFSMTCVARNLLDNVRTARTRNHSLISVLASAAGIGAFHVCGALACGYGAGLFLLSSLFPAFFLELLSGYSLFIILLSIGLQLGALYQMRCRPHFRSILRIE
jgi:hypothetical protein